MSSNKYYYRALLGCLAVVVVGGGLSLYGLNKDKNQKPIENQNTSMEQEPVEQVIVNRTPNVEESMAEREKVASENIEKAKADVKAEVKTEVAFSEETDTAAAGIFSADPLFATPLTGEIVMDYSLDHTIYDVTLEQYRTNEYVSISGELGADVVSSENGVVLSVYVDDERGNSVVIDHNNGWKTTYSQLGDKPFVNEGEKVKKGQKIGQVGEPTKYGVMLGNHLDFAMMKDGEYVDPKTALAE